MSDLDAYLDREIARARWSLLLTAIVCSIIVLAVFAVARKSVEVAGKRLSPASVVDQAGAIADREMASSEANIDEHLRLWIPQMLEGGAQSAIDGVTRYRQDLEARFGTVLKPGDGKAIGQAVHGYLAGGKVESDFGRLFDQGAKSRLDAIFAPISMTRDRLQRLAANGNDLLPFDRLTRRSIAVLLRERR